MSNNKKGLIIFALMLIATLVTSTFSRSTDSYGVASQFGDTIAVVNVVGIISENDGATYSQQFLLETIDQLMYDANNKGILLHIDTTGGAVYETDEAYLKLMEYKAQTGRPIYAAMSHYGASGGYYIASAADKIFANRNTLTGSLGVIMGSSVDMTALFDKLGIKMTTFSAGSNKNMRGIDEPITDQHRAIMQSLLDEFYNQFVAVIAESRDMTLEEVRLLADGRLYSAQQAVDNGLIDDIATFEEAEALLFEETGVPYGNSVYYSYNAPTHFLDDFLGFTGQGKALENAIKPFDGLAYYCPL